jgi:ATP-dependent helicase/DNAse subunit B
MKDPLVPPIRHALTELFSIDKKGMKTADDHIQIIKAPSPVRMTEEVARECKRLIVHEGMMPRDIGIIYRIVDDAKTLTDIFERLGLPVECSHGTLSRCPSVNAALSLLRLITNDFPRSEVITVLRSGYVDNKIEGVPQLSSIDRLDHISRAAAIVGGKDQWLGHLANLAEQLKRFRRAGRAGLSEDEVEELEAVLPTHLSPEEVRDVFVYMGKFFELFETMPKEAHREKYIESYQGLLDNFGLGEHLVSRKQPRVSARDVQGFVRFTRLLNDMKASSEELGISEVTLDTFIREIVSMIESAPWDQAASRVGGITIMNVLETRQLNFPVVFIVGLSERSFPMVHREALFFRDNDREKLEQHGVLLPTRHRKQLAEARLFHEAVSRADEQLYLVFPSEDSRGRETVVSHYYEEVSEAFTEELPVRTVALSELVPSIECTYHPLEALESVFLHVWDGRPDDSSAEILTWLVHSGSCAAPGLSWREVVKKSFHGGSVERKRLLPVPTPYDVLLITDAVREELISFFHPGKEYSASQFEIYGKCPFTYFCKYLLRVTPLEEPTYEMSPLIRGQLYHEVLRRFYSEHSPSHEGDTNPGTADELLQTVDEVFDRYEQLGLSSHQGIWRTEKERCRQDLLLWLEREKELLGAKHRPVLFEEKFGSGESASPAVALGDEEILLRGRVDRADRVGSSGYALFDYKTGRTPEGADIKYGRALQLPIYDLALKSHPAMKGRKPILWGYYRVRNRPVGIDGKTMIIDPEEMAAWTRRLAVYVSRRVRRMREGWYVPAWWKPCRWCDYRVVCRHDTELLLKKWKKPARGNLGKGTER